MKTECVDEIRMAEYIEGLLAEGEARELESHLSDCETCLEELILAKRLLRAENDEEFTPAPAGAAESAMRLVNGLETGSHGYPVEGAVGWIHRLGRGISRFLGAAFSGPMRPALIRGSDRVVSGDRVSFGKSFGRLKVRIEIEKTGESRALIRVWATENGREPENVRITLKRGEREVRSLLLNQGYVLMEEIPFGYYGLEFMGDGGALGAHVLEIVETKK